MTTNDSVQNGVQRFELSRKDNVDLAFDGVLLAKESTEAPGRDFWSEVRIFRTTTGRYVVEQVGVSVNGETRGPGPRVVDTPAEVRAALTRKRRESGDVYLTNTAYNALIAAAEKDPALEAAFVEEV